MQLDYKKTIMESEENVKKKYVRRLLSSIWKINDTRVNAKWSSEIGWVLWCSLICFEIEKVQYLFPCSRN